MYKYDDDSFVQNEAVYGAQPVVLHGDFGNAASSGRAYAFAKRTLDIALSLTALVVLSPLLLLVGLIILIDDPHGNPIYVSKRCGKGGREFNFYKFRSMCVDAEKRRAQLHGLNEMDGPVFKIKDDPRITRVGRIIRKLNIDELPQLVNILAGQMSLVGPRPPLPNEVAEYTPRQMERLSVTPGLTCLWQVQPSRNSLSFDEWIELDIQYIRRRNFRLDIKLIFRTILVVLQGEGQ